MIKFTFHKILCWFISISFFVSCKQPDNRNKPKDDNLSSSEHIVVRALIPDSINHATVISDTINKQIADRINIVFRKGEEHITVQGHIDSVNAQITCNFEIAFPKKLFASITTKKKQANIRFNQVIGPGKRSDGPFGRELEYQLIKKGQYQLIIGPSLMAEDAYKGDFSLDICLD